jgi:hypothetical protein
MQDLKFYVLGTKKSVLLELYTNKFLLLLQEKLLLLESENIITPKQKEYLQTPDAEGFLLSSNISSNILAICNNFQKTNI